eukprot:s1919_g5.t1
MRRMHIAKPSPIELGLEQASIDTLSAAGINSYATYAYCCTYQPGQNDDSALVQFLTQSLGAEPSAAATSKFRRLFFEAHALSLEDLKSRADRSESSEARVIPLAEKMDRIRLQKDRLVGISFTAQTEPSHNLIDRVCQQLEDNVISYVELQKCTSRQDETLHAKVDTSVSLDNSGGLRLSKKQRLDDVNVTGEHRLRQAFLRRSLAYDLSGIGTFAVMDIWTQKLFEKMNETPVTNFRHVTVEQILNADKALWVKVSDDTRGKLQTKTGEDKAFDKSFQKFSEHPEVLQHLTPLQASSMTRGDSSSSFHQGGKGKGAQSSDGKGKHAKGKGKSSNPGITVPDDCEIFVDGKQLCKRWQLGRCTAKIKPGKRCMVGWHMCWKKGCHKNHPGNERLGFQVFAIDHAANRHSPKVKPFLLDVANVEQLNLLKSMISFSKPCYVHLGLPCGTCSRAREKPMPAALGGHMGPRPLRDAGNLLGLPGLQGSDKAKVELSNQLYNAAISILMLCFLIGCLISIENPARSWLWQLLAMLVRQTEHPAFIAWYSQLESVYFDACAHGSSRDKRTKLLATPGLFTDLAQNCPGDHRHSSWQPYRSEQGVVFPTAQEAEYPALLCTRMADCVLQEAEKRNIRPVLNPRLKDLLKLGLGQQSLRHAPLIPEYSHYLHLEEPSNNAAHKLLAAPLHSGATNTEQPSESKKRARTTFKYGVWHSPEEFLQKAQNVKHPMDQESFLHEATKEAICKVVHTDPTALAKERLANVYRMRKLADELNDEEAALKGSLNEDVRKCVAIKNISLFKHLLETLGFWDLGVVDLVCKGVPLVGMQEPPEGYQKMLVPASMTEDELTFTAPWRRKSLMSARRGLSREEEDALLSATAEEVEKGFLGGPYTEDEISVLLGTEG